MYSFGWRIEGMKSAHQSEVSEDWKMRQEDVYNRWFSLYRVSYSKSE